MNYNGVIFKNIGLNKKRGMQDKTIISQKMGEHLFAVLDGHGENGVIDYLERYFTKYFFRFRNRGYSVIDTIYRTIECLQDDILQDNISGGMYRPTQIGPPNFNL